MSYNAASHPQTSPAPAADTQCDDDSMLTSILPDGAQLAAVAVLPGSENGLSAAANLNIDASADGGTTDMAIGGKFGSLFAGGAGTSAGFGPDGADASVQVAFAADAPVGTAPAWGSASIGAPSADTGIQVALAADAPADVGIGGSDCGMLEGGPLSLGLFGSDPVSLSGLDIPALDICSLDQTA